MMRAMVLDAPGQPLREASVPVPRVSAGQLLVRVRCCGVCRTDLHVLDGELTKPALPLILGHQVVGTVERIGAGIDGIVEGQRVGIPWLGKSCRMCLRCRKGYENLCPNALFTGYQIQGGYAEYMLVDARFALTLPGSYEDREVAPLLCAGLIGHRALHLAGDPARIGVIGFGASAHIVTQVAKHQGRKVFAFTKPLDVERQRFAIAMGADWVGGSDQLPPEPLDAALIFAPVGSLVPKALKAVGPGGRVICAGIHMSDIPSFPYELLWGERAVISVANATRRDGADFLALAPRIPVRTETHAYPLEEANRALDDLRHGRFAGAAVLMV